MKDVEHFEGRLLATGKRFAIVATRFNEAVVDRLVSGAIDCLVRHGASAEDLVVMRVPGAWELPLALRELAAQERFDGLVALGAVIRGETPHFDFVAGEGTSGTARVMTDARLPIGFGLLTCDSPEQAQERAGGKVGNKGWEAALATLEMVDLLAQLRAAKP